MNTLIAIHSVNVKDVIKLENFGHPYLVTKKTNVGDTTTLIAYDLVDEQRELICLPKATWITRMGEM